METMRGAAPLIVGTGVATAEEIGMETLEQRVRDEAQRTQAGVEGALPCCSAHKRRPAQSNAADLLTWTASSGATVIFAVVVASMPVMGCLQGTDHRPYRDQPQRPGCPRPPVPGSQCRQALSDITR
jgi:hypothetical protein